MLDSTIINKEGDKFIIPKYKLKFLKLGYFKIIKPGDLTEEEVEFYNSKYVF